MKKNSRDDISVQEAVAAARKRVLERSFVKDPHMPGLYLPKQTISMHQSFLDRAEDRIAGERYAQKIIQERLPAGAINDLNNWTEQTQARLDELAKKLEI